VETLDNVERIAAPDPVTFARRYLHTGTPVVLQGLFDRTPLRELADPRRAQHALADVPLAVTLNDIGEFLQGREELATRSATFGAFVEELLTGAASRDFCVEYATPDELLAYVPPPSYVGLGDPTDTWETYLYMAGAGNAVHLHYDCDQRHVLMVQVFGRKRYVVVDPAESRKLAPGSRPHVRRTSALFLEHMSPADLAAFLRYANAWDCVLEPGEALLIPATCWHYVAYLDAALSVNFRFGRNRYLRTLAEIMPESSVEMQALAARFRDERGVGPGERAAFAELEATDEAWYPNLATRRTALDALCVRLCARLDLPVAGRGYHVADIERRHRVMSRS
jgi:hypothetical protein